MPPRPSQKAIKIYCLHKFDSCMYYDYTIKIGTYIVVVNKPYKLYTYKQCRSIKCVEESNITLKIICTFKRFIYVCT